MLLAQAHLRLGIDGKEEASPKEEKIRRLNLF
jgi:hypothetical protein